MSLNPVGTETDDIRFSLTPERVDQTQRQTYIDNFGSNGFLDSKTAMENITGSSTIMGNIVSDTNAIDALTSSATARDAIGLSGSGFNVISESKVAMGKYVAGLAGFDPSNYADIDTIFAEASAMEVVVSSPTALEALASSPTALEALASSPTALEAVASSPTAISTIESNSYKEQYTAYAGSDLSTSIDLSNDAPIYIAELEGGGGSGANNSLVGGSGGQPGGDTVLHETTAEGGEDKTTDSPGGFTVNNPDTLLNGEVGGGGAGGPSVDGPGGSPGGFVKSLIANDTRDVLTLVVGKGGVESSTEGEPGEAAIYIPNVFINE